METPPVLFIEIALLRLGEEIVNGLDTKTRTERVAQIVEHWCSQGMFDDVVKDKLLSCWGELVLSVKVRDVEERIQRSEAQHKSGSDEPENLQELVKHWYIDYCMCVGDCLDSLAIA